MQGRIPILACDSESSRRRNLCLTHHSSRLEGMSKSAAIVGKPTTTSPAKKALISVTHTTVTNTIVVVAFFGFCIASEVAASIGRMPSASGVSSSPLRCNLDGCERLRGVDAAKVSNSTEVVVRDMFAEIRAPKMQQSGVLNKGAPSAAICCSCAE